MPEIRLLPFACGPWQMPQPFCCLTAAGSATQVHPSTMAVDALPDALRGALARESGPTLDPASGLGARIGTLSWYLQRIDNSAVERVLGGTMRLFKAKKCRRHPRVAADRVGLVYNAASTFCIRRIEELYRRMIRRSYWLNHFIVNDLTQLIILIQHTCQALWGECRSLSEAGRSRQPYQPDQIRAGRRRIRR
jgi:hypothetical protein